MEVDLDHSQPKSEKQNGHQKTNGHHKMKLSITPQKMQKHNKRKNITVGGNSTIRASDSYLINRSGALLVF